MKNVGTRDPPVGRFFFGYWLIVGHVEYSSFYRKTPFWLYRLFINVYQISSTYLHLKQIEGSLMINTSWRLLDYVSFHWSRMLHRFYPSHEQSVQSNHLLWLKWLVLPDTFKTFRLNLWGHTKRIWRTDLSVREIHRLALVWRSRFMKDLLKSLYHPQQKQGWQKPIIIYFRANKGQFLGDCHSYYANLNDSFRFIWDDFFLTQVPNLRRWNLPFPQQSRPGNF